MTSRLDAAILAGTEATFRELERQREILRRQEGRYLTTRPAARFAVAAHITKTESKIGRLERALERRSAMTTIRTRRSLAEQLREAFDDLVAKGEIESWSSHYGEPSSRPEHGGKVYHVHAERDFGPFGVDVDYRFTPGEAMDFVNEHGCDVVIGKA